MCVCVCVSGPNTALTKSWTDILSAFDQLLVVMKENYVPKVLVQVRGHMLTPEHMYSAAHIARCVRLSSVVCLRVYAGGSDVLLHSPYLHPDADPCVCCMCVCVYASFQALFKQLFSFVNVQLFNQLLLRRECCSFSNGEYVKTGLSQVEIWIQGAGATYVADSWDELKYIRQVRKHTYRCACPLSTVIFLSRILNNDARLTRAVWHGRKKGLCVCVLRAGCDSPSDRQQGEKDT